MIKHPISSEKDNLHYHNEEVQLLHPALRKIAYENHAEIERLRLKEEKRKIEEFKRLQILQEKLKQLSFMHKASKHNTSPDSPKKKKPHLSMMEKQKILENKILRKGKALHHSPFRV